MGWKFWEWLFYKNMKNTFNEGLPYITHFVVLHPFLKRPQILLTFIRHLTLIKSNLIDILFLIKFEQFHIFCAYSKLQWVVANRATQGTILLCHLFKLFWDLKSVLDRFISHHNLIIKYECMFFYFISFLRLKKCLGLLY